MEQIHKINELYDAIIIGGGPAGLTAALYLARARYRVLAVEKEHFGGQIAITSEVVNYPGVERTSGTALTDTMRPELVTACQRIAAEQDSVTAEVYDLNHFPDLRDAYQVMSVPCLVVNETTVSFGKKNIKQVLDVLKEANP